MAERRLTAPDAAITLVHSLLRYFDISRTTLAYRKPRTAAQWRSFQGVHRQELADQGPICFSKAAIQRDERDRRHPANHDLHYRRGFAKAPLNAESTDEFDPLETLTRFIVLMEILHYLTQLG